MAPDGSRAGACGQRSAGVVRSRVRNRGCRLLSRDSSRARARRYVTASCGASRGTRRSVLARQPLARLGGAVGPARSHWNRGDRDRRLLADAAEHGPSAGGWWVGWPLAVTAEPADSPTGRPCARAVRVCRDRSGSQRSTGVPGVRCRPAHGRSGRWHTGCRWAHRVGRLQRTPVE